MSADSQSPTQGEGRSQKHRHGKKWILQFLQFAKLRTPVMSTKSSSAPHAPSAPLLMSQLTHVLPDLTEPVIVNGGPPGRPVPPVPARAASPVPGQPGPSGTATPMAASGPPPGLFSNYNPHLMTPPNRYATCGHLTMTRVVSSGLLPCNRIPLNVLKTDHRATV